MSTNIQSNTEDTELLKLIEKRIKVLETQVNFYLSIMDKHLERIKDAQTHRDILKETIDYWENQIINIKINMKLKGDEENG